MLTDFISFLIKHLVRVISEHYNRNVKGIFSEPTKRFPHTRGSSSIHLSPATRGDKNPEYSIVLSKTYPKREK